MSRLRRPFPYERFLFVTVKLLPHRTRLNEEDFARLANSLSRLRQKHGFLLTAWVLLPERWSSMVEFAGVSGEEQERRCGRRIDRVPLPFDLQARI